MNNPEEMKIPFYSHTSSLAMIEMDIVYDGYGHNGFAAFLRSTYSVGDRA
jgi:hypothetical protein